MKEALNALVLKVSTKLDLKGPLEYEEEALGAIKAQSNLIRPCSEDSKGNKRILLQLGNSMCGYLFLLFRGLMDCIEGYK
jgi:hypothetical protein